MFKKKAILAAVAAFALAAAGVAAASAVTHPQSFRTLASRSTTGSVTLHTTKVGKVLATRAGMTLYLFRVDKSGKSACYGQCATYWPPLLKKGALTAGTGVKAKLLGLALINYFGPELVHDAVKELGSGILRDKAQDAELLTAIVTKPDIVGIQK